MAYADQEMSGSRVVAIIIVALIHIGIGYVLVTGLAYSAAKTLIEEMTVVEIDVPDEPEPPEEEPLPPPPEDVPDTAPPPIVVPQPPINVNVTPPRTPTVDNAPPDRAVNLDFRPNPNVGDPPPPPAPPPPPDLSRAADRSNFSRWQRQVVDEGYPRRALSRELEGNVGVRVTIGTNGRVSGCTVTSSSGESILDRGACAAMERYARYEPALDSEGNPTTGSDSIVIVYRLN